MRLYVYSNSAFLSMYVPNNVYSCPRMFLNVNPRTDHDLDHLDPNLPS